MRIKRLHAFPHKQLLASLRKGARERSLTIEGFRLPNFASVANTVMCKFAIVDSWRFPLSNTDNNVNSVNSNCWSAEAIASVAPQKGLANAR